jgi:hypothetical protein
MTTTSGSTTDHDFTVRVRKATFVPDLDAIREFAKELKGELDFDDDAAQKFNDDPSGFLGSRGLNQDLQNEFLVEQGLAGADLDCGILSCVITDGCVITSPVIVVVS